MGYRVVADLGGAHFQTERSEVPKVGLPEARQRAGVRRDPVPHRGRFVSCDVYSRRSVLSSHSRNSWGSIGTRRCVRSLGAEILIA